MRRSQVIRGVSIPDAAQICAFRCGSMPHKISGCDVVFSSKAMWCHRGRPRQGSEPNSSKESGNDEVEAASIAQHFTVN
jgi:hypothetical protein